MEQKFQLIWQNIEINIVYNSNYSKCYREVYGYGICHLQIHSAIPLPITETSYLSHFVRTDSIEEWGEPVEYLQSWLDQEAKNLSWQDQLDRSRQLCLF